MQYYYSCLIDGQESPESMPNEVAYKLSELLGYDHYLIHLALVSLNPELVAIDGDFYLVLEFLPAVVDKIGEMLLAGAMLSL